MDLAMAAVPLRPNAEHRSSYASSTFSTHSAASQPLSPSSETPRSPSEVGEADEARVHRKLLDLEITNRSLLAINSALEVTKLKQAREIRELKKRLRDGKGLPVAATSRSSAGSAAFSDEDDLTDSDDDDDDLLVKDDPELEAAHQRCKLLVDHMVEQARKAILAEHDKPEHTGGKVLHPAELEEMQRELDEDGNNAEADTTAATDLLESSVTFDSSVADLSQSGHLPSSSSQFSELSELSGMDSSLASVSLQSIDVVFSGGADSNATSRDGSAPNMPYGGNLPSYPDVSID
uniref:Uncharacterized protein n=2 Tax=Kalmanozyma brasiliensis (strain GHG001) TaxID=1365824 RepID=V5E4H3_KALBG